MKPPPPRWPAPGQVTASANAVATAASTALPPFFKVSMPTFDAIGSTDTTAAFVYDGACTSGLARYADTEDVSNSVITVSIHRMVPCPRSKDGLFLCPNIMRRIFLNADKLDHFLVQQDALLYGNGPWLCVRFGIVNCDFDLEAPEDWPAESFGHFRSISQGIADDIQPTLVDEMTRLNDERISVPSSHPLSIPQ